jgi:hypothetical protein
MAARTPDLRPNTRLPPARYPFLAPPPKTWSVRELSQGLVCFTPNERPWVVQKRLDTPADVRRLQPAEGHWLSVEGMPRRYADYLPEDNFTAMNQFATIGSYLLGASLLPFFWNVYVTWCKGEKVEVDDPWGFGASLEWATSCPPPRHNFTSLPRIRSERPALDLRHPEISIREHNPDHSAVAGALGAADIGDRDVRDPNPDK